MEKALVLVEDSLLRCDKGSALSALKVSSQGFAMANNCLIATEADCEPYENIAPFGICAITQKPCTLNLLRWQGQVAFYRVNGLSVVTEKSALPCAIGGMISPETVS